MGLVMVCFLGNFGLVHFVFGDKNAFAAEHFFCDAAISVD